MKHTMESLTELMSNNGYITEDGFSSDCLDISADGMTRSYSLTDTPDDYGRPMPEMAEKYAGWLCLGCGMPERFEGTVQAIREEMKDITDSGQAAQSGALQAFPIVAQYEEIDGCPTPEDFVRKVADGVIELVPRYDIEDRPVTEDFFEDYFLTRQLYDAGELGALSVPYTDGPKVAVSEASIRKAAEMISGMEDFSDVQAVTGAFLKSLLLGTYDPAGNYSEVFGAEGASVEDADTSYIKNAERPVSPEELRENL